MANIPDPSIVYRQFDAAFARVAAYVILKNGELVAKVAIKRSASNLRASAFVHWIGVPLVCGTANGGGYDKDSAAVAAGARKILNPTTQIHGEWSDDWQAFVKAASLDGGKRWDDAVRDAGFTVIQAV
ncbi:MAG TPA: hypothetical protein VIU82_00275 [Bosea sp. (in: a-proteobacteria)]